jgi:hypothetical protein
MDRAEILDRVQKRIGRSDTTTNALIHKWINEVVMTIEQLYPFAYLKRSNNAILTANENSYTLPSDLILHHPFDFMLKGTGSTTEYQIIVKVRDRVFNQYFTMPEESGDGIDYFVLRGGNNSLNFDIFPVPTTARTVRYGGWYAYTDWAITDSTDTTDENWLTVYYPDAVLEGVLSKAFREYGMSSEALEATQYYQAYINGNVEMGVLGLIQAEKKKERQGRMLRIKTLDDMPLDIAKKMRTYGH